MGRRSPRGPQPENLNMPQTFDNTNGVREMILKRKHRFGGEPDTTLFVAPGTVLEAPGTIYDYEITQDGVAPPAEPEPPAE
jgi:hypothetical protein